MSTLIWTTQQHERVDKLSRGRVEWYLTIL